MWGHGYLFHIPLQRDKQTKNILQVLRYSTLTHGLHVHPSRGMER